MAIRTLAALTVLTVGTITALDPACAQFFRQSPPPQATVAEDDDDGDVVQPPVAANPPAVIEQRPYDLPPAGQAPDSRVYVDRPVARGDAASPTYPPPGPTVLVPPSFIYPEDSNRVRPGDPNFGRSADPNMRPQDSAAIPSGPTDGALRPPGAVGAVGAVQPVPGGVAQPGAGASAPDQRAIAALPPEDQPEFGDVKELPPNLKRQLVDFTTREPAGTIIIDTPNTYLYLVMGNGKALRYGIGVGREGFTWSGTERISRMAEWPDWHPPEEMIDRQPYLPRFMAGGLGNPLGARALYLGKTLYRIHGTNQPSTIGTFVSSGCIRLTNADVEDLFSRVKVGTRVVVMPGRAPATAANNVPAPSAAPATR